MQKNVKHIIIGAGLSGLVTAYKLLQSGETDFLIIEARNRVGGRVYTKNSIDLGATWLQGYHSELLGLLNELNIEVFDQYSEGQSMLVYSSMAPVHFFEMDKEQAPSMRINGGSRSLIAALYELVKEKVVLNEAVISIEESKELIVVNTSKKTYHSSNLVITLPPLMASNLKYSPNLPGDLLYAMQKTHTWMSNAIKVGLEFDSAFWRAKGFSGTVIGQASPVIELYDHSNAEGTSFSLKGFVNESLRELSKEERKERILSFLETHFGKEIRSYIRYTVKDWSIDKFTSGEKLNSYYLSPQYGNTVFQKMYFNSKVVFSGTETAQAYGGYLEGAVRSGMNAYAMITKQNEA